MKFWKIFRFEFAHQLHSITTWIYLSVLLGFTLLMNLITTPGDGVYDNNTFHIISIVVVGGMLWLVMGAAIAGESAARDVQTRMHPLTYSSPIEKFDYLGGRFLAALSLNALLLLFLPLGALISFYLPGLNETGLLPFRPSVYLSAYFFIALPNAFVATAVQFSFATLSRQVMTSYMASLTLAIFPQLIAVTAANLFGHQDLLKLLDPIGLIGIMGSELSTWTPTEKNTRLVSLEGMFLWNRILWIGVAIGMLLVTYVRFSFAHTSTVSWWSRFKRKIKSDEDTPALTTAIIVPQVARSFSFATYFYQTLTLARISFRKIASHPVGLTLVALIALASALFGSRIMTQFGIPLVPTTNLVLQYLTAPVGDISSPWVVIPLLIMYFAGQLIWSERDERLGDTVDSLPVPEWTFLTGKFLGLSLIIIVWMTTLLAAGIFMQINLEYDNFQIGLYVQTLFGLQLIDYLLFALLALVVHVIVNEKKMGHLIMLLIFLFIAFPSAFQVEHNMLIFGAGPSWSYSDMRGFGPTLWPWLCFKLYWIAWALLLAVAARLFWVRGREHRWKYRLRLAKHRFTRATVLILVIGVGLLFSLGSFVFYNTNVLNEYESSSDVNGRKAAYELRYGNYANSPQPQLTATKLNVEIFPDQQQVEIHAIYTLVNRNAVSIDSIHLVSGSGIEPADVKFNRSANGVLIDKKLYYYIYSFEQPLQPGDSVQLSFAVHFKPHGFNHRGVNTSVIKKGTYFTNYDLLPAVGYKHYREINDPVIRKKYNLVARPAIPSLYDLKARKNPVSQDETTFEAIVGTAENEVAVAPGALQRSWAEGNRRYFHYKTDESIGNEYAILSGNYAVKESKWNDPERSGQVVDIRIYYHSGHALNIDRMLRSAEGALKYCTEHFGPYPYRHLTVVERAGNGGGASADASMINYGEQYSLMKPDDGAHGFDLPYYILAHEVAHQWWGLARLTPANVEGTGVLIEGLAVYSGMQILRENYSEGHLQKYLDYLHSFYEMPRSLATPSLLQANESFLYYRKGGLAMYVLSKYIGTEKVNGALRNFLNKRTSGEILVPTTLDLYQEIKKVTPDSLNYLLLDLFEKNTYWRLKTKQLAADKVKSGNYEVTLKVHAQKVVIDSTGNEKEVSMNDWLEVGLYEEGKDEPLYLQRHRIKSGEQIIKVTVPRRPERGGIDPNYLMIDLRRDDNIMYIKSGISNKTDD
jgi:ABC-2 type transport system permease protein